MDGRRVFRLCHDGPVTDLSPAVDSRTDLASTGIPLGPLDGRYRAAVSPLVEHLSEAALNRERIRVEVEWLIWLSENQAVPGVRGLTPSEISSLRAVVTGFGEAEVAELAAIERETMHDVKAVEYFVKRRMTGDLVQLQELVHFCCTSEDINNLAYALMIRGAVTEVWLPRARALVAQLATMATELRDLPMLSRTHGQAATPTTLGKELAVLAHRLNRQLLRIQRAEFLGKINGATGTYAAHLAAVPGTDWEAIAQGFVQELGLTWNPLTTQIEPHDWQAELYSDLVRCNRILHNLCTDLWTYISLGYFAQVRGQGTVGSSTMPHKVNPIRFENAEANLELSCALFDVLSATLVTSRLQRDLTDSSTQRSIGTAFGHSLLALDNISRGLAGLDPVPSALSADLSANWEVLGEAIQSAMRAAGLAGTSGMEEPYERLKELTRGRRVDGPILRDFIQGLGLPTDICARLVELSPAEYTGLASELVRHLDPGK